MNFTPVSKRNRTGSSKVRKPKPATAAMFNQKLVPSSESTMDEVEKYRQGRIAIKCPTTKNL